MKPSARQNNQSMEPNASFEDEILAINPEYDLIFNRHKEPRQKKSSPHPLETRLRHDPNKMKIISKMNEIIGTRPIGELPTHHDWEDNECIEKETIALMRQMGLEASVDRPPDENRTISTVPVNEDVIIMRNGRKRMPIYMSNAYFELKPRVEVSFGTDDDETTPTDLTISEFSDDVNLYEPIPMNTTNETVITTVSVSDDSFQEKQREPTVNSDESANAYLRRTMPNWVRARKAPEATTSSSNSNSSSSSSRRRSSENWRNSSKESKSQSNSASSSSNWRRSNESSFENERDEKNWRVTKTVAKSPDQPAISKKKQRAITTEKQPAISKEKQPAVTQLQPQLVSNCGSPLFKPKELFLKKKAMMIQQVLADNQP